MPARPKPASVKPVAPPPAPPRTRVRHHQAPVAQKPQGLGASTWAARNLETTDEPGIFLNAEGIRVDKAGVAVEYKTATYRDTDRLAAALGRPITSPADLLCAAALDDTLSLGVRMDAAKAAAPYFDRKQPIRVENEDIPNTPFSPEQLSKLGDKELDQLYALLDKLGLTSEAPAAPSAKQRGAKA